MPTRGAKGRSRSRGRAAASPKAAPAKKASVTSTASKMDFEEGDQVMARWPGTSLFYRSKITYVREEDNEYDCQFEDGTVYTLKAKDVKKNVAKKDTGKKTPSRSRSRGRSPGRKPKSAASSPATSSTRVSRRSAAVTAAPKPEQTPTRQSARIAAKADAISDDEERSKAIPNPDIPTGSKKSTLIGSLKNISFEWVGTLVMMAFFPFILISLHTLCTKTSCKIALPFDKLPKTLKGYYDPQALLMVIGFSFALRVLALLPIGSLVRTANGNEVRMNGFLSLWTLFGTVGLLAYKKLIDLSVVQSKYFYLMTSSLILALVMSLVARIWAYFFPGKKSNVNPKGNTGNFIVDFFNGREFNPYIGRHDIKLHTFRYSMIGLAVLNLAMVLDDFMKAGKVNGPVSMAACFQIIYSMDAMFFEEYFFFSHDAMNTGYGFSLVSSYNSFPFLPTLITRYLIFRHPTVQWYYLVGIAVLYLVGYIIFRASETQRCEFAKDPGNAAMKNLETLPTAGGRKLLISGWWGIVRHPNFLGEILIQWAWVLPAVCTAGKVDLLVYYLPIFTTLVLLIRCRQQNARNRKKYGNAWQTYCERVPKNLIPKVY